MNYENIIFDFDGTLADTAALIVETMHRTIRELGLPEKSDTECRSMIGYRLEDIPAVLWPDTPDLTEKYAGTYRDIFNTMKTSFKVELFPHVLETLSTLHDAGLRMAIASSRGKDSIRIFADHFGISGYFQSIIGGSDVKEGKPSPEPVNTILSQQNWDNGRTLVVGDMDVDIRMGNRAGTDTCGVTYGNGTAEQLRNAGAKYVIPNFAELPGIVSHNG